MTLLTSALHAVSPLRAAVRNHLDALSAADAALIALSERPKVGDSINLDAAMRPAFPQANRWDYLMSVPTLHHIIGLEPHSAKDSEISVVIAKKQCASAYLRNHLRPSNRVARWFWVCTG